MNFVGIWYEVTSSATPWAGSTTWKRWTTLYLTFGKFKQSACLNQEDKGFGQKTESEGETVGFSLNTQVLLSIFVLPAGLLYF